jgi:hypothetical protein
MTTPHLYGQLQTQLSQWITPKDKRHLTVFCENVAAILQSESVCLSHWLKYLSHRCCKARSQMERLHYFVHNPNITAETFYIPFLVVQKTFQAYFEQIYHTLKRPILVDFL